MIRIIHAADVHISSGKDKAYSLEVLKEIVLTANKEKADYLLFCGDLFDRFTDARDLRAKIRTIADSYKGEIFFLPGNHEELGRPENSFLNKLDFGKIKPISENSIQFFQRDDIEFVAFPHRHDFSDYDISSVPPKKAKFRIALAHAIVPEMLSYTGPDEEGNAPLLDPDICSRLDVDYTALGHIHKRCVKNINNITFSYPGSARVWRSGEFEPRGVMLLEIDKKINERFIQLNSAGEFREYEISLQPNGKIPDISEIQKKWESPDHIRILLSGVVEDETIVSQAADRLKKEIIKQNIRRVDVNRDAVIVTAAFSTQPLARAFLDEWKKEEPSNENEKRSWLRARELAFKFINGVSG